MNYVNSDMINKKIIKVIIILLIIILIFFLVILKFKNSNKNISEPKNKNEELINDYSYLLSRLYPNSCAVEDIKEYINLDRLSNEIKIEVAINNLSLKRVEIKETDEFDLYNNEKIDFEWLYSLKDYGIDAKTVDSKVKKIFGEDTVVHHESTDDIIYDKTAKIYIIPPHGCGDYSKNWFQNIISVEKKEDELYIYTVAGSIINRTYEIDKIKICYDDNYKNLDEENCCILLTSLENKYKLNDNNSDIDYDYEQYALDNKDKFNQYKYTFVKEGKNYIIKNLEITK